MTTKHSAWQSACEVEAEFRDLRKRLEQAEARCAELEDACIRVVQVAPPKGPLWHGSPHVQQVREALGKAPTGSWLFRKQAEALEVEAQSWREDGKTNQVADDIQESAQRLRQQADELDN